MGCLQQYVSEQALKPGFTGDPSFYLHRLLSDSARLFQDTSGQFEVLHWHRGSQGNRVLQLDSVKALETFLARPQASHENTVYVIRQPHTWDNLSVTRDAFVVLLSRNKVFLPFLDCVHSFGFRTDDDNEVWEGCHRRVPDLSIQGDAEYEICYTYRYVALNGRAEGPSWSIRQIAVYEKRDIHTGCSNWVLIQPGEAVWNRFQSTAHMDSAEVADQQPALRHCMLLTSATEGWKGYLSHLQLQIKEISEKANFIRLTDKRPDDFIISFRDAQKLERLRAKVIRALLILRVQMDVICGVESHCHHLQKHTDIRASPAMSQNLKDLKSSVAYFRLAFQALLDQSKGTVSLLRQIVKYRLTEDVNQSTRALGASMLVQRSLTARMQADNEGMLRLAEQGRQDDVRIKTLTLITILYLPATLIATIFSSNLVDTRAVDDNSPPARLAITPQFWIYVLVTAGFTILTLAVPTLVERGVLWRRGKGKREMPRQGRTENKETIGDKLDVERA